MGRFRTAEPPFNWIEVVPPPLKPKRFHWSDVSKCLRLVEFFSLADAGGSVTCLPESFLALGAIAIVTA